MYGNDREGGFGPRRSFAPVKVGEEIDVKIEAVGEKGDGIAKKAGFVIFVPGVKQGDEVKIRVTKVLRKVGFAEVVGKKAAGESTEEPEATEEEPATEEATEEQEEVPDQQEDSENFGEEEEPKPKKKKKKDDEDEGELPEEDEDDQEPTADEEKEAELNEEIPADEEK
jgi:predicted RNA-binding protein with TRAM domain